MGNGASHRVLPVSKSSGQTTYQYVRRIGKLTGIEKIGHAGTLDPVAEGLILILTGEATKLSGYLMDLPKTYRTTIKFGESTDTKDSTGRVLNRGDWSKLEEEKIRSSLARMVGEREQVPPMYSALKHRGTPLYVLARRGERIEREPRRVVVYRIECLECRLPEVELRIKCSRGFYVRVFAENVGKAMGVPSHMNGLVREEIGHFSLENSFDDDSLESIPEQKEPGCSMADALRHLPAYHMIARQADKLNHGIPPQPYHIDLDEGELVRLLRDDGWLGGIAVMNGEGGLSIKRVFLKDQPGRKGRN